MTTDEAKLAFAINGLEKIMAYSNESKAPLVGECCNIASIALSKIKTIQEAERLGHVGN
jgi:hypothetical protein